MIPVWIFIIPVLILAAVVTVVVLTIRFFIKKRKGKLNEDKNWHVQICFSKEDAVSQFFFLFSVLFFGLTLVAFNRELGEVISWQTVVFITSLVGLFIGYYFRLLYTIILSTVGIITWWGIQAALWANLEKEIGVINSNDFIKPIVIMVGVFLIVFILYLIGRILEKDIKFKRLSVVYSFVSLFSVGGILFAFSLKDGLNALQYATKGLSVFASIELSFSVFLFIAALVGLLFYTSGKKIISKYETLAVLFLAVLFIVLVFVPDLSLFAKNKGYYYNAELSSTGVLLAVLFNVLIFLYIVGVIFLGYMRHENYVINIGAFFMFILIITKYFDWFFQSLDKSIFFIGAGILLFGIGWLMERGRRYMLSSIKEETQV